MKAVQVILLLLLLLSGNLLFAQGNKPTETAKPQATEEELPKASIKWLANKHDFGDIQEGQKITFSYTYENTGKVPLILSNVNTTCGCTASEWSRDPLLPGQKGKVTITFDSKGKVGRQNKVITVISNSDSMESQLFLSGSVVPAKK